MRGLFTLLALGVLASVGSAQDVLYEVLGDQPFRRFGFSVTGGADVNGDGVDDFAVGGSDRIGVYSGSDGALKLAVNGSGLFGAAIGFAGDVNVDGTIDLVVGAPASDGSAGRTYLISGVDGAVLWSVVGDGFNDQLGRLVGDAGDLDGDGYADVIAASGAGFGGSLYTRLLSGKDGSSLHAFDGTEVASSVGDLDADGCDDLLVRTADAPSAVSVYSGRTLALLYQVAGSDGDGFGGALHGLPDIDDDHVADFLVGAVAYSGSGYARVCSGVDGHTLFTLSGDGGGTDLFAYSVGSAGDVDGDGRSDFLVGSPAESHGGGSPGAAWLYSGKTGALLYVFDGTPVASGSGGEFLGISVAGVGDVDHDGRSEVVVGAYESDKNGTSSGRAVVFSGNDLYHTALPRHVAAGETLVHTTREGSQGMPTVLSVVAVNDAPTFLLVFGLGFFDGTGSRAIAVTVPPGLSGFRVTHRAFALTPAGRVIDSGLEKVTFE